MPQSTTTVIPTGRWKIAKLTFLGLGSISRHRNIHTPVICPQAIADRLIAKFYATPAP